jgi:hypothetical protein
LVQVFVIATRIGDDGQSSILPLKILRQEGEEGEDERVSDEGRGEQEGKGEAEDDVGEGEGKEGEDERVRSHGDLNLLGW